MENPGFKVYPYRWIVLAVFALINAVVQLNWIAFAPITVDCIGLYHTTPFWIVFLSMSFMLVYIFVSVPASYIIDKFGIHVGVGIGAVLTGIFAYMRGAYAMDFQMVLISQMLLAVAQPFILNAITKVAAEWFPLKERATADGIATLAQFIGIIVAMGLTKTIAQSYLPAGVEKLDLDAIRQVLELYGILSVGAAVLFLIFARSKPATPPCSDADYARISILEGIKYLFRKKDMLILLLIFFIGLGMFNAISTFIDLILASKGFRGTEAENVGALMMIAGVLGAIVIPPISDKLMKRKACFVLCTVGVFPGLVGLTFFTSYVPLMISSGVFGFFFMAAAPLGYQYAAEVGHPAPESTSQGMIVLSGQISGALFITLMAMLGKISIDAMADVSKASESISLMPFMIGFVVLSVVNIALSMSMKESSMMETAKR